MSRSPELDDDLQRLGLYLEAAAAAAVRRESRRQAVMNFVGAIVIAVPLAIGVAATDLAPGDGMRYRPPQPSIFSLATEPPTNAFMVRHIPDESLPPRSAPQCLDANDCRTPRRPSLEPAPAGRL